MLNNTKTKKQMKQEKPKRTKIIKVPVTEEQYKDLKFIAKAKGMPLARYVRQHYIK